MLKANATQPEGYGWVEKSSIAELRLEKRLP
jgi:hypothetical protein